MMPPFKSKARKTTEKHLRRTPSVCEGLERRIHLAGVTIITHGFQSSAGSGSWVDQMADEIALQAGGSATVSQFTMFVHRDLPSNLKYIEFSRDAGSPVWGSAQNTSGEAIIKIDWSDMDAGPVASVPTGVVANLAADYLLAGPIDGHRIAELPIHLIGHSRGASLMTAFAQRLGQIGVWVDQFTSLDPHPVDGLGGDDVFNFSDTPMKLWDNVVFADNYWREDGANTDQPFDFDGEFVPGAHNVQLSESVLSQGGYPDLLLGGSASPQHSDVHLWYNGTIGSNGLFNDSDGSAVAGPNWYSSPHPSRNQSGFYFSLIHGGARPASGLRSPDNRTPVALTATGANVWDNVLITDYTSDSIATVGSRLAVTPSFEDKNLDASITIGLDTDRNPYTAGPANNRQTKHTASGVSFSVDTSGLSTGNPYYLYAKISNGTHARYDYALGSITLTTTPQTAAPYIDSVSPSSFAGKPLGQLRTITITGTGFTNKSTLKFNDQQQNYYSDPTRLRFIDSTRIEYDISVGPNGASWTVQVLDSQKSNVKGFTVTKISVSNTKTWTGNFSSNWGDADNWSPVGVPQSSDTVVINGATVNTSGFAVDSVTLKGAAVLNWTSGYITGEGTTLIVELGAVLNINGTDERNWAGELNNAGTVNLNGTVRLYAGYSGYGPLAINNLAGGIFNFHNDATFLSANSNSLIFNNSGTLKKSGGTGTTGLYSVAFTNGGTVQATSGTLYFNGTVYDEGVFNVSSDAVVNLANGGTFDAAATSAGSGKVLLSGVLNGTLNGSNFELCTFSGGSLTLTGIMNWSSGYIYDGTALTLTSGAVLNINGTDERNWAGELNNAGTVNLNGTVRLYAGYSGYGPLAINNLAGGIFNFQSDATLLSANNNSLVFNNFGAIKKSGGTGTTGLYSVAFTNSGSVQVTSGTFYFNGTVYDEGVFNVSSGAVIYLANGGTFDAAATSTGSGTVFLSSVLNGTLNGSNFELSTFSGGSLTLTGTMNWTSGYITGSTTTLTVASGAVLNINGTDERNWAGELNNAGTVNLNGTVRLYAGYGGYGPLAINNLAGGIFNFQSDATLLSANNNSLVFNNFGAIKKSGGTGTTGLYSVAFTNSGIVQATSGTLSLGTANGSTSTNGQFVFANNAVISLSGYLALNGTQTGAGAGLFSIDGGTLRVQAGESATLNFGSNSAVRWTGGTIVADGDFTNIGDFQWTGGNLQGTGFVHNTGKFSWSGGNLLMGLANAGSAFTVTGTAFKSISSGGVLTNTGTITHIDNGGISGGPGTLYNLDGALYDFQGDGYLSVEVNNYGTIRKSEGGATSSIGSPFRNFGVIESNNGNLAVGGFTQYAGSTILNGGNLSGSFDLQGGELRGTGSITGTVNNIAGVIRPGLPLGYIIINGPYYQKKAGRVEFEIGGTIQGFQYDRLEVINSTATLDGILQASFVNGFVPTASNQFNVLFHAGRSGQFSTMSLATANNGLRLTPTYNATGVTLKMTSLPPLLVTGSQFLTLPQRLTIQFSDDVSASLAKSDLTIIDRNFGITVPQATMAMSYNTANNTATFTFPGFPGGALLVGDYRATLPARSVQNTAGMELDSDLVKDFTISLDTAAPVADFVDVAPDPHSSEVDQISLVFNEAITGLDLADLLLTRNGSGNLLTDSQTLSSGDGITYTLGNMAALTAAPGIYVLTLAATASGITDLAGNALIADAIESWVMDTLFVNAGMFAFGPSDTTGNLRVVVTNNASILLNTSQLFASVTLTDTAQAILASDGDIILGTRALSIAPSAKLDLANNSLVVQTPSNQTAALLESLSSRIAFGAIFSSNAKTFPNHLTGLAIRPNQDANGNKLPGFEAYETSDIIIMYTWNGDTNLNRRIDIDDYITVDTSFLAQTPGQEIPYHKGDFNFDKVINIDDYNVIDLAFLGQNKQVLD